MKFLYGFYFDCGRIGALEGLFVATEKEVEDAIGKDAYFGEVLGKHSEVFGELEDGEMTKINISSEAVEEVSRYLGSNWSGFNPLEYIKISCEECEYEERASEWDCEYRLEFDQVLCLECVEELKKNN